MVQAAIVTLGELGPGASKAAVPLCKLLERSYDPGNASLIVDALAGLGTGSTEPAAKLLESKQARVRASAAEVLGLLGEGAKPALPALERASRDRDPEVRRAVEEALRRIKG